MSSIAPAATQLRHPASRLYLWRGRSTLRVFFLVGDDDGCLYLESNVDWGDDYLLVAHWNAARRERSERGPNDRNKSGTL